MNELLQILPGAERRESEARAFVADFLNPGLRKPKFLFGRNVYAESLIKLVTVDGVIDDFTTENAYFDVPIIKSNQIPPNALVLAASGGQLITAKKKLDCLGVANLNYFAFRAHAPVQLHPVVFNEGFIEDFSRNKNKYAEVLALFADQESKEIFRKLITFRLTSDIEVMRGFVNNEANQYFEEFLDLKSDEEVFYDVGCFDGATSLAFASRCPDYRAIHAFEPEVGNHLVCARNLSVLDRVTLHGIGLSSEPGEFAFDPRGSASSMNSTGSEKIKVVALDSLTIDPPSLLKLDIEGAELACLKGAVNTITTANPRLAVAVYHYAHGAAPFWQVPAQVLSARNDYEVRLRHYTESIYETVMFFTPKSAYPW